MCACAHFSSLWEYRGFLGNIYAYGINQEYWQRLHITMPNKTKKSVRNLPRRKHMCHCLYFYCVYFSKKVKSWNGSLYTVMGWIVSLCLPSLLKKKQKQNYVEVLASVPQNVTLLRTRIIENVKISLSRNRVSL